jgi:hypothetical protein
MYCAVSEKIAAQGYNGIVDDKIERGSAAARMRGLLWRMKWTKQNEADCSTINCLRTFDLEIFYWQKFFAS